MKLFYVLFAVIISQTAFCQFPYEFRILNNTYADLSGSTSLNNGQIWDDPQYTIPIGFNFQIFDTVVNTIYITEEGSGGALNFDNSGTGTSPMFFAYGLDIIDRGADSNQVSMSNISYKLTGTTGQHILKIEWNNVGFYNDISENDVSTDFINFQVWLYEGSNTIEIHFGPNSISDPFTSFEGQTGTFILLGEAFNMDTYEITDTVAYLSGPPVSANMLLNGMPDTLTNFMLDGIIPNGTVYRFYTIPGSVNLSEVDKDITLNASPNPTNHWLNINYTKGDFSIKNATILNLSGQNISTINDPNAPIDVSLLSNGIYFIAVEFTNGQTITKKWVKIN